MMLIGLIGLALIIAVAALAAVDAARWSAARPPDEPLDMPQRAARQTQPTGLTVMVQQIDARKGGRSWQ